MKTIIILVLAAIVLTVIVDALRKRGQRSANAPGPNDAVRLVPANEAPPTETGRLRVAHIVSALKKSEEKAAEEAKQGEKPKPEEEKLPDPFENK